MHVWVYLARQEGDGFTARANRAAVPGTLVADPLVFHMLCGLKYAARKGRSKPSAADQQTGQEARLCLASSARARFPRQQDS